MDAAYVRAKATVDRVLRAKGQPLSIVVGGKTQRTFGAPLSYNIKDVDGTNIRRGDKRILMSAVGITGDVKGGILTVGGVPHTIIESEPFAAGGLITHFYIQARQG